MGDIWLLSQGKTRLDSGNCSLIQVRHYQVHSVTEVDFPLADLRSLNYLEVIQGYRPLNVQWLHESEPKFAVAYENLGVVSVSSYAHTRCGLLTASSSKWTIHFEDEESTMIDTIAIPTLA